MLVTPPPILNCCAYPKWKGLVQHVATHFSNRLAPIYEEVAKETGSKLLNLHEVYKGKPEQELCDNQHLAMFEESQTSGPNFCNPIHWGRAEIVKGLNDILLVPETAKIKGE